MTMRSRLAKLEMRFPAKPAQEHGWPADFLLVRACGTSRHDMKREMCRRLKMMLADPRGASETTCNDWREWLAKFEAMLAPAGALGPKERQYERKIATGET